MILSNAGLHAALDAGDLVITPEPGPRRPTAGQRSCPYDTCSVNLRLGPQISIPKPGRPITLDLRRGGIAAFLPVDSTPFANPSEFHSQSTPTGQ